MERHKVVVPGHQLDFDERRLAASDRLGLHLHIAIVLLVFYVTHNRQQNKHKTETKTQAVASTKEAYRTGLEEFLPFGRRRATRDFDRDFFDYV